MKTFDLIKLHLCELPFFAGHALRRLTFMSAVVAANPHLPLGGLPLTPKYARYGTGEHFLPTHLFVKDDATQVFADTHAPVVTKPVYGSQSRNVEKHNALDVSMYEAAEPLMIQPFVSGREFAICVARCGDDVDLYSTVEIIPEGEVWEGAATYKNITSHCQTDRLRRVCKIACQEAGLNFGRFDVKAESLADLQAGNFRILEINGSTALDLRLYTPASWLQKRAWLREHWENMFAVGDGFAEETSAPWGLLIHCLAFTIAPHWAVRSWHKLHENDLASGSESEWRPPGSGSTADLHEPISD